ncbi:MAG: bifunctional phosphoribosyl-AMP cyclohydrolase/phosphoribosyl-ATP diphosphatase HisIE [Epulopiscium sp.]|nr:bifunctional phosphoribosyl-AMP cyclohydrolase/phosphoribosyl-ATP diphosphatase HisIE [Candidatus Epulonipiscium sp.]
MEVIASIKFDNNGLIPVITQDNLTREVLMLAYMNEEALQKTLETMKVHYYSRSRKQLWLKGEASGHYQKVKKISLDCDHDTLLIQVEQIGGACHTGHKSCFYQDLEKKKGLVEKQDLVFDPVETYASQILKDVYNVVVDRKNNPKEGSYTNYLLEKGLDKILKKVGEETAEVIIGAKNQNPEEITYEVADLLYHLTVLMVNQNVSWEDIFLELKKRYV